MKKVVFALAIVAFAAGSCSSERTCNCTVGGQNISVTLEGTKSEAEDACNAAQATYRIGDSGATCTLD
jgi:hypothetical protein